MINEILLPDAVRKILEILQNEGFEAYIVGGCVRDSILGREPNDWDITTSAMPEQVKKLFRRTIDTGIQHGTVTVMIGEEGYEVTTYRIDGEYEDGRHPKEVIFTASLEEDLKRRDFTINAMAYNPQEGLVDLFDGQGDMEQKIIRCVGNPIERFTEDALRMLRAIRFSAQLGYSIEEKTLEAVAELAPNLYHVSAERIRTELEKTIVSGHPEKIRIAYECGLTAQFLPEFDLCMKTPQNNPHHIYNVGEHIIHSMIAVRNDRILRLAMLLHDIAKPQALTIDEKGITHNYGHPELGSKMAQDILRRLKYDNKTIHDVAILIRFHDRRFSSDPSKVRKIIHEVTPELFPLLIEVQEADLAAQSDYQREIKEERIRVVKEVYAGILEAGDPLSLKELAVSGADLRMEGMKPGPEMGEMLGWLLEKVLEQPELNTKEELMRLYHQKQKC